MPTILHIFLYAALAMIGQGPDPARPTVAPAKLALLVAVGDYPSGSGWETLSSDNDLRILKSALLQQGFQESDIAVLHDGQATRQGIIEAIRAHLTNRVKPGDAAIFHFSGHGQQVQDDKGDELDGFDEALVPHDSPLHYEAGVYEGENLIRDEELGALLREVRAKLGKNGRLLTLIDACHSGTATRGMAKARGTQVRMASPAYLAAHSGKTGDLNALANEVPDVDGLAPMVAFFSASPNQLSYEQTMDDGNTYGILSLTFSKAFGETHEGTTYRDLFDKIRLEISALSPRQTAQSEGLLDVEVLGGEIKGRLPYFTVSENIDSNHKVLDGGILAGLTERSVVAFYPLGIKDTVGVAPKAIGIVESADLFSCEVELQGKKLGKTEAMNSKVFIRERNFGNLSVSLRLELQAGVLLDSLQTLPSECPAIHLAGSGAELVLQEGPDERQLQLRTKDGFGLDTFDIPDSGRLKGLKRGIRNNIIAFAQAKFLRPIEMEDESLRASVELLTIEGQPKNSFRIGEKAILHIRNTGTEAFYFSLLDLLPSNEMRAIIPHGKPAVDYFLLPGGLFEMSEPVTIEGPPGTEVLKLIVSEQPLDLSNIVNTRGEKRGGNSPLEVLFRETYLLDNKRGGTTSNMSGGGVAISSVVVEIQESNEH